jgi:hypothetical protein
MDHEIFAQYHLQRERDEDLYECNLVGCRTRLAYERHLKTPLNDHLMSSGKTELRYDDEGGNGNVSFNCSEDYYEWIDLLEAIHAAHGRFTMIELGAGYGRWIANAALAARRIRDGRRLQLCLVGVEADERRFQWMSEHLSLNGIDEKNTLLICNGISDKHSHGLIKTASVHEGYGEKIHPVDVSVVKHFIDQKILQVYVPDIPDPYQIIDVIPISEVIRRSFAKWGEGVIDLMDIDIQGAEETALEHSIDMINGYVKRMHIGTHAKRIDEALYNLLIENDWRIKRLYASKSVAYGEFGKFMTIDGIISCVNTRIP